YRWQYLLEPLGSARFGSAFRATAVGFAASSVLPARAGEVIRPYFLARQEAGDDRMTATGAFATIILERLFDVVTVLVLLALFVFVFGGDLHRTNPVAYGWLMGMASLGAAGAIVALVVLFALAADPERLGRFIARLARVVPSLAVRIGRIVER